MKTYIYIDDEDVNTLNSLAGAINACGIIKVMVFPLGDYKSFDALTAEITKMWDKIDGLILDLKLNGDGPNSTHFSATSLTQWIRSSMILNSLTQKPIILLSNDLQCAKYTEDVTSHDLFDLVMERNGDINWDQFANQLEILASGYEIVNHDTEKDFVKFLNNDELDKSATCFANFTRPSSFNVGAFASFILHDLFEHPGILISESLLASRVGVDLEKSREYWRSFKEKHFKKAQYSGVFVGMKELYWSHSSMRILKELLGGKSPATMSSVQRVKTISSIDSEASNLVGFVPNPGAHNKSLYTWVIDEVTKQPLDAAEGYVIYEEPGLKAWQEPRFVSFDTIEMGKFNKHLLIPSEEERYDEDLISMSHE